MNSKKSAEKHTIFTILINCALKLHTVETTTTTTYTNTTNWCLFACFLALYEHKRSRIWIQNTSWLSCQWKQLNSWILFEAKNNRWLCLQSLIFWKPTECTILMIAPRWIIISHKFNWRFPFFSCFIIFKVLF